VDLVLSAHQAFRHGLLVDQERSGDLGCAQPEEDAQRRRDLRLDGERRLAAGEEEP
jgi:hypothetical protein